MPVTAKYKSTTLKNENCLPRELTKVGNSFIPPLKFQSFGERNVSFSCYNLGWIWLYERGKNERKLKRNIWIKVETWDPDIIFKIFSHLFTTKHTLNVIPYCATWSDENFIDPGIISYTKVSNALFAKFLSEGGRRGEGEGCINLKKTISCCMSR